MIALRQEVCRDDLGSVSSTYYGRFQRAVIIGVSQRPPTTVSKHPQIENIFSCASNTSSTFSALQVNRITSSNSFPMTLGEARFVGVFSSSLRSS